ncbi:glutathione S-transferase C-terminal domain-containing protein, partial [Dyella sp.]|uniref:glutathione S-transferase C-terminal domain-containing protein n=1 Tax=Dyella sp. TaxID=1869338 RepID=UPI002ED134AA
GEQHDRAFLVINPNGKLPAIIDTDDAGNPVRVFDSNAILLYLGDKAGRFVATPAERGELLSWLFFIATGVGPFSGQAVHFQHSAPEKIPYAIRRYRSEVQRHYQVLDDHLKDRAFIVGDAYSIVDMAGWGWLERAPRVLPGEGGALEAYPHLKRWYDSVDSRPAAARARTISGDHVFKKDMDEEARHALFPSNYR